MLSAHYHSSNALIMMSTSSLRLRSSSALLRSSCLVIFLFLPCLCLPCSSSSRTKWVSRVVSWKDSQWSADCIDNIYESSLISETIWADLFIVVYVCFLLIKTLPPSLAPPSGLAECVLHKCQKCHRVWPVSPCLSAPVSPSPGVGAGARGRLLLSVAQVIVASLASVILTTPGGRDCRVSSIRAAYHWPQDGLFIL